MTLRARLTLAVAGIVATVVIVGSLASYVSTRDELRSETDKFLVTRSARFTEPDRQGGSHDEDRRFEVDAPPTSGPDGAPIAELDAVTQLVSADRTVTTVAASQPVLPVDSRDVELAGNPDGNGDGRRLRDVHVGGVHYRMLTAALPNGGAVQIARAMTETDDVLGGLRNRLLVITLGGTIVAALVGFLLARRTTRPIQHLTDTAGHIAQTQDLETPIPVQGHDEVGRLAGSFNTMLVALATSREQQKRLVADASHELRTPLTAVRTNIEFLERAGDTLAPEEQRTLLEETRIELAELTTLVGELVDLATDVRGDEPEGDVDLAEVVDDVAARYRRRTGRVIDVDAAEAATVTGRRAMIERAVSNLVENALKFSDAPAPVEIVAAASRIDVLDRGPGIPTADHRRVFDRFYRSDAARTRPGSGLGLSIVAQIAAAHDGSASVHDRPGGGTIARLELGSSTILT